ncbi:MAG: C40 family peptidase [Fibrobacter sp.]|jgi:cell wall-associated NlpC family hydrolase|nr:C40 family peptidase [Fibrobacter sp.]
MKSSGPGFGLSAVFISAVLFFSGCAPSVKYSRGSPQTGTTSKQYLVPRDWDYRKNYQIPQSRLSSVIASYIGTPYRYGGMSRKGVDCSGFVCLVFRDVSRVKLPHSTRKLRKYGRVVPMQQARHGDLIFFKGSRGIVNHVGIFLGEGRFAHASSSKGVIYSNLSEKYYSQRLLEVRRLFK